jgi:hypothetical protein
MDEEASELLAAKLGTNVVLTAALVKPTPPSQKALQKLGGGGGGEVQG